MSHTALRIEFGSARFPFDPPPGTGESDIVGEDLCRWLCAALAQWPLDYVQEDWGWLLGSDRARAVDADSDHQLCVYAYPPGSLDSDVALSANGEWMLVLHRRVRSVRWKIFHYWEYASFDPALAAGLIAALRGIDAQDLRASALRLDSSGKATDSTPYLPERLEL